MPHHTDLAAIAAAIEASAEAETLAREWLEANGAAIPEGEARWYDIGPAGRQITVLGGWGPLDPPLDSFIITTPGT